MIVLVCSWFIIEYSKFALFIPALNRKIKKNKIKIKKLGLSPRFHYMSHPSKLSNIILRILRLDIWMRRFIRRHVNNEDTDHLA